MLQKAAKQTILAIAAAAVVLLVLVPASSGVWAAQDTGNLEVTYNYTGESSGKEAVGIPFQVKLYDGQGKLLKESYPCTGGSSGATIKSLDEVEIKSGKKLVINDLPAGSAYQVTMAKVPVSITASPSIKEGTIKASQTEKISFDCGDEKGKISAYIPVDNRVNGDISFKDVSFTYNLTPVSGTESNKVTLGNGKLTLKGPGKGLFEPISYRDAEESVFKLTQEKGDIPGMVYDESEWTVKVTVVQFNESFKLTMKFEKDGQEYDVPFFENKTELKPIEFSPAVSKVLEGEAPSDSEFKISLSAKKSNPEGAELPKNTSASVHKDRGGSFDPIKISKPGSYDFIMREQNEDAPGYEYDSKEWTLHLDVEEQGGELVIAQKSLTRDGEAQSQGDVAVFSNRYNSGSLRITKTVVGKETDASFAFTVSLTDEGGAPLSGTYPVSGSAATSEIADGGNLTLKANESATISKLPAGAKFTVVENNLPAGFTSAIEPGSGSITKDETVEVSCQNAYSAESVTLKPTVKKVLEGDSPSSPATFTFEIASEGDATEGFEMPENKEATVSGAGTGQFESIKFTKEGEYAFIITEKSQDTPGYTFDASKWRLSVSVVDNEEAKLSIGSATYTKMDVPEPTTANDAATFTNRYTLKPVTVKPKVKKTIEGDFPKNSRTFKFSLTEGEDGEQRNEPESGKVKEGELTMDLKEVEGQESEAEFGELQFTRPGTYHYQIQEIETNSKLGYSFDSSIWDLTVKVSDVDSNLQAECSYQKRDNPETKANPDHAEFLNTYSSGKLSISKTVTGTETDRTFSFKIDLTDKGTGTPLSDSYPYSVGEEEKGEFTTGTTIQIPAGKAALISGIPTGAAYNVEEVEIPNGYTSSLTASAGEVGENATVEVTCENAYKPSPTRFTAQVSKALSGHTPPKNTDFAFSLAPADENPKGGDGIGPEGLTVTLSGQGDASFEEIEYSQAGNYNYTITETDLGAVGYEYDKSTYTLNVNVVDEDGALRVESSSYSKAGADEEEPPQKAAFTNNYAPLEATYAPKVKKVVEGDTASDESFSFKLASAQESPNVVMPENLSLTITGSGDGEFSPITFKEAGTFTFNITEDNLGSPGYEYDASVWHLEVLVEDKEGTLQISKVSYSTDEMMQSEAVLQESGIEAEDTQQGQNLADPSDGSGGPSGGPAQDEPAPEDGASIEGAPEEAQPAQPESQDGASEDESMDAPNGQDPTAEQTGGEVNNSDGMDELGTEELLQEGSESPNSIQKDFEVSLWGASPSKGSGNPESPEGEKSEAPLTASRIDFKKVYSPAEQVDSLNQLEAADGAQAAEPAEDPEADEPLQGKAGVVPLDTSNAAAFVNKYAGGTLKIQKQVQGVSEEESPKFTFSLSLKNPEGKDLDGSFNYSGDSTGEVSSGSEFELKGGESIVISDIPFGTNYAVSEKETSDYAISSSGEVGVITEGSESLASFTNSLLPTVRQEDPSGSAETPSADANINAGKVSRVQSTPQTGDASRIRAIAGGLIATGTLIVGLKGSNKVRRNREEKESK